MNAREITSKTESLSSDPGNNHGGSDNAQPQRFFAHYHHESTERCRQKDANNNPVEPFHVPPFSCSDRFEPLEFPPDHDAKLTVGLMKQIRIMSFFPFDVT